MSGPVRFTHPEGRDCAVGNLFKESEDAVKLTVKTIREMTDPEILLALATAVRIPPMIRRDH